MNFKNFIKNFVPFSLLLLAFVAGASPSFADTATQSYSAANAPGIQSCTKGYDLLSGEQQYSKQLIKGALPYSIIYKGQVRSNGWSIINYLDPMQTAGGWSDNYTNYIANFVQPDAITLSASAKYGAGQYLAEVYVVKLPGVEQEFYFHELIKIAPNGGVQVDSNGNLESEVTRINDAVDPLSKQFLTEEGTQPSSGTQYGDINFSKSQANGQIIVIRNGITYIATISQLSQNGSWNQGTAYLRFTQATYPNGTKLTFGYDSNFNMTTVEDNRNNKLTLTHSPSQTIPFTNGSNPQISNAALPMQLPVSDVKLFTQSQTGYGSNNDIQEAELYYYTYDSYDQKNNPVRRYIPRVVYNYALNNGNAIATFNYSVYLTGGMSFAFQLLHGQSTVDPNKYGFPILASVYNELGNQVENWLYSNQNYVFNPANQTLSTSQTTVTAALYPGNTTNVYPSNANTVWGTTTTYDDVANTISMSFAPDNVNNQTTSISMSTPSNTQMTMNISGYPCVTDGAHPLSQVVFDTGNARVTSITDYNQNQTTYAYEALQRIWYVIEAVGTQFQRKTTYYYTTLSDGSTPNNFNTPNSIAAPELNVTNTINLRGQITEQDKAYPNQPTSLSQKITYVYYEDSSQPNYGLLKYMTPPRESAGQIQEATWYFYDTNGNISQTQRNVSSNGTRVLRTTSYTNYNSAGLPQNISYPDGSTDTIQYDSAYHAHITTHTSGSLTQITTATYDALQHLQWSQDSDGFITNYIYDNLGRLAQKTAPNGNYETYAYFPNNVIHQVKQIGSNGTTISMQDKELDGNGRVRRTQNGWAGGQTVDLVYDNNGNVKNTTTALGIVNQWTYDSLNRVATHIDGNNYTDTKDFDDADNNKTESAANTAGSSRLFKNQNLLRQEQNSDFGEKDYAYDLDNNPTGITHVDRQCAFNSIDEMNRPVNNTCSSTASNYSSLAYNDSYVYDQSAYGNLDHVTANTADGVNTDYGYDTLHRVTSKSQHNTTPQAWGYPSSTLTNGYTYSTAGRLQTFTYPSGNKVTFGYDNTSGMLARIQWGTTYILQNITYDGADRLSNFTWGNGGTWQQWLNDQNLVQKIVNTGSGGNQVFQETYDVYDNDGNLKQKTKNSTDIFTYGYDNNYQLTSEGFTNAPAGGTTYSTSYTYDNNGNRKTVSSTNPLIGSATYTYVTNNHLATWSKNGVSMPFSYTNQGEMNQTYSGPASYDYAGRRREEGQNPNYPQYTFEHFDYNHKHERTFRGGSNIDRQYAYDESSHLIGEYDASGNVIVEYVWMGDRPVAAVYPGNRIVYITTDYLGKPRQGMDAQTGQQVWYWNPDAFGVQQPTDVTLTNGVVINLRFPGQYFDVQSGLYYNLNRFYSPELGRYMEPDPTGLKAGLNPYAYAGNNPVMNTDPTGLLSADDYRGMYALDWEAYKAGQLTYDQFTKNAQMYGESIAHPSSDFFNWSNLSNAVMFFLTDGLAKNSVVSSASTDTTMSPLLQRYLSGSGGRWGSSSTRALNDELATGLEAKGFTITGGAGRASEEWFAGPGGGTKGGTFVDITATNGTSTIRIQTVTTLSDGVTPTPAEAAAAARIRAQFPNDKLILVPKR